MKKAKTKIFNMAVLLVLPITFTSNALANEKIIQQEKISFEKCLKVITTSQDKLAIAPKINDLSNQRRVAVFTLADGTLTITCDKEKGNVTVSTNTD
tara:strand:- start:64 stop:354 length:291 start_codon:yes stop_codon:yes gene_type:complete